VIAEAVAAWHIAHLLAARRREHRTAPVWVQVDMRGHVEAYPYATRLPELPDKPRGAS
jgi:hypothetical protein